MRVYLNGEYLEQARAAVSVDDRGFLFGDGVYEVTRARNGRLFEAGRHLRRLERGLEALGIAPPPGFEPGGGALLEIADRLLRDNGLMNGDALVYLEITRGVAERTHHFPPAGTPPTVFLRTNRLAAPDDVRERGATVITTPDLRWERCDLKTEQLRGASELFLTSTSTEVMPVARLDGGAVGSGRPGPVARQLHAALRERLERDTTRAPAV